MSELGVMEKQRDHPGVHFPPPLLFVVGLFAGVAIDRWWIALPLVPEGWSGMRPPVGWLLIGLWAAISAWAVVTFVRERNPIYPNRAATRLVTWGPYALSRNPMYVALSLLYLGASILVDSLWPILLLPAVLALLHALVIRREERYLASAFGEEYGAYRRRVRRWI